MEWLTTIAEDTVAELPEVLRTPRFEAFLSVLAGRFQVLEDAARTSQEGWWWANAAGLQLDGIGEVVLLPRGAMGDAEYKLHLQARVKLLRGNATPADLLYLFLLLCPAPLTLALREEYPAALVLRVGGAVPALPLGLASILQQGKSAGVRALLEYLAVSPGTTLTLANADTTGVTAYQCPGGDVPLLGVRLELFDASGTTTDGPVATILDAGLFPPGMTEVRLRITTPALADSATYEYSLDGGATWLAGVDSTDTASATPHTLTTLGAGAGDSVGVGVYFYDMTGAYAGVEVYRWMLNTPGEYYGHTAGCVGRLHA